MARYHKDLGIYIERKILKKYGKEIVGTGKTKEEALQNFHELKIKYLESPLQETGETFKSVQGMHGKFFDIQLPIVTRSENDSTGDSWLSKTINKIRGKKSSQGS